MIKYEHRTDLLTSLSESEARKLPAVRLSNQTWRRHESGVRRVGLENDAQERLSVLRTILNNKGGKKCRPSVQTYGGALCCDRGVRSGELRLRGSVWNVRRKLDGPPRGCSATLPTTHLCFLPDTPPSICFLLLLFDRKSHWDRMRRHGGRSAALLFRRALVSWLTAHPVCARHRSCSAYQLRARCRKM